MSRETIKKNLPYITAFAEGKVVEYRFADREHHDDNWDVITERGADIFDNNKWEFRVKPEPREFWLYRDKDEEWGVASNGPPSPIWDEVIHVREVIEE